MNNAVVLSRIMGQYGHAPLQEWMGLETNIEQEIRFSASAPQAMWRQSEGQAGMWQHNMPQMIVGTQGDNASSKSMPLRLEGTQRSDTLGTRKGMELIYQRYKKLKSTEAVWGVTR